MPKILINSFGCFQWEDDINLDFPNNLIFRRHLEFWFWVPSSISLYLLCNRNRKGFNLSQQRKNYILVLIYSAPRPHHINRAKTPSFHESECHFPRSRKL